MQVLRMCDAWCVFAFHTICLCILLDEIMNDRHSTAHPMVIKDHWFCSICFCIMKYPQLRLRVMVFSCSGNLFCTSTILYTIKNISYPDFFPSVFCSRCNQCFAVVIYRDIYTILQLPHSGGCRWRRQNLAEEIYLQKTRYLEYYTYVVWYKNM